MIELSIQHQARELLHGIDMLNLCLRLPIGNAATRRQWGKDLRRARTDLEALYVAGLDRDFCTAAE